MLPNIHGTRIAACENELSSSSLQGAPLASPLKAQEGNRGCAETLEKMLSNG